MFSLGIWHHYRVFHNRWHQHVGVFHKAVFQWKMTQISDKSADNQSEAKLSFVTDDTFCETPPGMAFIFTTQKSYVMHSSVFNHPINKKRKQEKHPSLKEFPGAYCLTRHSVCYAPDYTSISTKPGVRKSWPTAHWDCAAYPSKFVKTSVCNFQIQVFTTFRLSKRCR